MSFAFVRNPFSKLQSAFNFISQWSGISTVGMTGKVEEESLYLGPPMTTFLTHGPYNIQTNSRGFTMWVFPLAPWSLYVFVLAVFGVTTLLRKNLKVSRRAASLLVFATIYLVIVISVAFEEWRIDRIVEKFDLDGNNIFSPDEETPEMIYWSSRKINDAGRTFAPVTGAFFALCCTAVYWSAELIWKRLNSW